MNQESESASDASEEPDESGVDLKGLSIAVVSVVAALGLWLAGAAEDGSSLQVPWLIVQVAVISIAVWQACDPFADAAQWIGKRYGIPGSIRGATLDAIASSMPELFTGLFFVLTAVWSVTAGEDRENVLALAEGVGSTIATCAGSAVYNMILIPAFCALVISYTRPARPTIDVEPEVISRDGIWFVCCEILLIFFLFQDAMHWWMGVALLLVYAVYILQLYTDSGRFKVRAAALQKHFEQHGAEQPAAAVVRALAAERVKVSANLVMQLQENFAATGRCVSDGDHEDDDDEAGVLFGLIRIPLNSLSAWSVIFVSTLAAAACCYFLVDATVTASRVLQVPSFFVAVIVAAAASSVPDTLLAIGAARRGDDSGAVSNAFGSNIFDICICLSIPLLVNAWLTGWKPVELLQDGQPIAGLTGLRILLVVLTIINLGIMWHNRQITRRKAWIMCALYGVFIGYAVLGSLGLLF